MIRPPEIVEAEIVDALAQRYGRLPREIREELERDPGLLAHFELVVTAPVDEES